MFLELQCRLCLALLQQKKPCHRDIICNLCCQFTHRMIVCPLYRGCPYLHKHMTLHMHIMWHQICTCVTCTMRHMHMHTHMTVKSHGHSQVYQWPQGPEPRCGQRGWHWGACFRCWWGECADTLARCCPRGGWTSQWSRPDWGPCPWPSPSAGPALGIGRQPGISPSTAGWTLQLQDWVRGEWSVWIINCFVTCHFINPMTGHPS